MAENWWDEYPDAEPAPSTGGTAVAAQQFGTQAIPAPPAPQGGNWWDEFPDADPAPVQPIPQAEPIPQEQLAQPEATPELWLQEKAKRIGREQEIESKLIPETHFYEVSREFSRQFGQLPSREQRKAYEGQRRIYSLAEELSLNPWAAKEDERVKKLSPTEKKMLDDAYHEIVASYPSPEAYQRQLNQAEISRRLEQAWFPNLKATGHGLATSIAAPLMRLIGKGELADDLHRFSDAYQQSAMERDKEGIIPSIIKRGARGVGQTVPTMVVAGRAAGPYGAIVTIAGQEVDRAITRGKDAGLSGAALTQYVIGQGLAEALPAIVLQRFGLGGVETVVGTSGRSAVAQGLGSGLKRAGIVTLQEIPQELVTEISQNAGDVISGVDPQALDADRLAQTVADTVVQTVMTSAVVTTPGIVESAISRKEARELKAPPEVVGKAQDRGEWLRKNPDKLKQLQEYRAKKAMARESEEERAPPIRGPSPEVREEPTESAGEVAPAPVEETPPEPVSKAETAPRAAQGPESAPEAPQEIKKWFGESKVVEENGEPLVVYHSSKDEITKFEHQPDSRSGPAFWFAGPSMRGNIPAAHNVPSDKTQGANVSPVYLKMDNPLVLDNKSMWEWAVEVYGDGSREFPMLITQDQKNRIKKDGYDGIMFSHGALMAEGAKKFGDEGAIHEYVVFEPNQIQSAIAPEAPAKSKGLKPVSEAKEPWQMTKTEYESQYPATPAPASFAGSKVTEDVYHGSPSDSIQEFSAKTKSTTGAKDSVLGTFFSQNSEIAATAAYGFSMFSAFSDKPRTLYTAKLNLKNPLLLDSLSTQQVANLEKAFPGFSEQYKKHTADKMPLLELFAEARGKKIKTDNFATWGKKAGLSREEIESQFKARSGTEFEAWDKVNEQAVKVASTSLGQKKLKALGYDGIILDTEEDSGEILGKQKQYVVFDPKNIAVTRRAPVVGHDIHVKTAYNMGKPVSAEVLAEYPDLVSKPVAAEDIAARRKFLLNEIDAWRSGAKATPGQPASGQNYPLVMRENVKRLENELAKLEQQPVSKPAAPEAPIKSPFFPQHAVQPKDQFGPVKKEHLEARKDFIAKAGPGATFTHSSYKGSKFRVQPDGTIYETTSQRGMGDVGKMANYLKPGQVTWTKEAPETPAEAVKAPEPVSTPETPPRAAQEPESAPEGPPVRSRAGTAGKLPTKMVGTKARKHVREYAVEAGIDQDAFEESVQETHQVALEEYERKREVKRAAHRKTGLNALDIARIRNGGYDYASDPKKVGGKTGEKLRHFDAYAAELANEYPETFGPEDGASQRVWDTLNEESGKKPRPDSPEIFGAAEERYHAAMLREEIDHEREKGRTDAEIQGDIRDGTEAGYREVEGQETEVDDEFLKEINDELSEDSEVQGTLFSEKGLPGQMNLFADTGVPEEMTAQPVSKPTAAETTEPKTKLQQAAEKASQDAMNELDSFGKMLKGKGMAMNAPLDPEVIAGAAKLTAKFVKAGALKFAAFFEQVAKEIGQAAANRIRPALESEWEKFRKTNEVPGMDQISRETTGTKNVKTDELREKAGLGERVSGEKESVEQWEEEAAKRIAEDPSYPGKLAEELVREPRTIDGVEEAALGQHLQSLENRRRAGEDVRGEMLDAVEASKAAGEEWGRSGRSRQTERAEDLSVAGIIRKHMDAVNKRPTGEQMAKYEEMAARIEELEGERDELQKKAALAEVEARIAEAKAKKKPTTPRPKIGSKKEKLQRQATNAASAFKTAWGNLFQVGAVYDPKREADKLAEITKAAANVVRAYTELGVNSFMEFMGRVKQDIGTLTNEQVKVFTDAWAEAKVVSPLGEKPEKSGVGKLARDLTRWAVESGIEGRENVIEAVHEELLDMGLDLSRSETMQAMSGYGEFRELAKDEVSVKVRGVKGEIQQLLKLEDMQAGQAPQKTGIERRKPTEEERRLTKKVNEEKKRGGYVVTDPARQLKSALNTAKTALRNRIADLEQEIAAREKIVKERTSLKADAELTALRGRRDTLLKEHKKIFPPKKSPFNDAHRLKMAERALERQIADLQSDLEAGRLGPKEKGAPLTSPELEANRQKLAELKEIREQAREASPEYQAQEAAKQTARYKKSLERRLAFWEQRLDEAKQGKMPAKRQRKTPTDKAILDKMLEVEGMKQQAQAEIEKVRRSNLNLGQKIHEGLLEVTSLLPRTLMAGLELSMVLRQGVFYTFGHPVKAFANLVQSTQAVFIERMALAQTENLAARANATNGDYSTGKVQFTQESGPLNAMEEMYQSAIVRWLEKTEGVLWFPLRFGAKAYMMTERGFRTFSNTMKADLFDLLKSDTTAIREFFGQKKPWTKADAKEVGRSSNIFSGRGTGLKGSHGWASWLFFARRWAWSRIQAEFIVPFQMVTPKFIGQWNADPAMRVAHAKLYAQALTGMAAYMAARYWLYFLLADDDDDKPAIEWDPRSSDFLKQKVGETRIDTLGGMQQPFVLAARVLSGTTKTAKGEIRSLYGEDVKWGQSDAADAIIQYGRGKLGPGPSGILDWFAGKNLVGQPKTTVDVIADRLTPMTYRDIWEAEKELNLKQGTVAAIEAFFGASVSTYGPRSTYRDATPEKREELFEKFIDNMEWDSGPPAYAKMLSAEQMEQVDKQLEKKKQSAVYEGLNPKPERSYHDTDESYQKKLDRRKKARERLREMIKALGLTHDKAQQLLIDSYRKIDKKGNWQDEHKAGSGRSIYDQKYFDPVMETGRAHALSKLYGLSGRAFEKYRDSAEFKAWDVKWAKEHLE